MVCYFAMIIVFGIVSLLYQDAIENKKLNAMFIDMDMDSAQDVSRYFFWVISKPTWMLAMAFAGIIALAVFMICLVVFGLENKKNCLMVFVLTALVSYVVIDNTLACFQRHVIVPNGGRSVSEKLLDATTRRIPDPEESE